MSFNWNDVASAFDQGNTAPTYQTSLPPPNNGGDFNNDYTTPGGGIYGNVDTPTYVYPQNQPLAPYQDPGQLSQQIWGNDNYYGDQQASNNYWNSVANAFGQDTGQQSQPQQGSNIWDNVASAFDQSPTQNQQPDTSGFNWDNFGTFLGNSLNTVNNSPQVDKTQGKDWWNVAWDAANNVAGAGLDAFGNVISNVGKATDAVADSGIPGLSQVGQGVRGVYENVVDPAMNMITSTIGGATGNGDLTKLPLFRGIGTLADVVTDPNHDIGQAINKNWQGVNTPTTALYNAVFNNQQYQDQANATKQQLVQQAYDQVIANGGSFEDAQKAVDAANRKYSNPLNVAEAPGIQGFSQLPAVAQLGFSLLDPAQNSVGEAVFNPAMRAAGKVGGKVGGTVADITHLDDLGAGIAKKLESRQQKANRGANEIEQYAGPVQSIMEASGDIEPQAYKALDEIVNNPDSPNYYTKLGLSDQSAEAMRTVVDAVKNKDLPQDTSFENLATGAKATGKEANFFGTEVQAPEAGAMDKLAQSVKDNETIRDVAPEKIAAADKLIQQFFPDSVKTTAKEAERIATAKDLKKLGPQVNDAVKMPKRLDAFSEYQRAANDVLGLKVGSKKLEGPIGKLKIRDRRTLEFDNKLGNAAASPLRLMSKTLGPMSRLYLNSPGRVVRDYLGNAAKVKAEGYTLLNKAKVNSRYEQIFGDQLPENLRHATGQSAEVNGKPKAAGAKENGLVRAAYFVASPINEAASAAVKVFSKGKYDSINALTERNEIAVKQHVYKQERLKQWDKAVADAMRRKEIPASLKAAYESGSLPANTIENFIANRMPQGADLGHAINGEYHPLNISPEVMEHNAKIFDGTGGQYGTVVGAMLDTLPDRLADWNNIKNAYQRYLDDWKDKNGTWERVVKNPDGTYHTEKAPETVGRKPQKLQEFAQKYKDVRIEDITPDHPIFKQMEKELKANLDEMYTAPVLEERVNPIIQEQVKTVTKDILRYAAQDKNLSTLKQALNREIARNEGLYKAQYKTDLLDQLNEKKAQATQQYVKPASTKYGKPGEKPAGPAPEALDRISKDERLKPNYPIDQLQVDPQRFQYKQHYGEGGSVGSLSGVQKFNKELAGVIQVWKDPADGKTYVVNGHNRYALAKRLGEKNLDVRVIQAKDAAEARAKGALTNIAEGQGTALDAAKYFKDTGSGPDVLAAQGLRLEGRIAKDGIALSNLADPLFNRVARGELAENRAVIIGSKVKDPTAQIELYRLLEKEEKTGRKLTDSQVSQLADQVAGTKATTEKQTNLFGTEEVKRFNLVEKAKLADYIATRIADEKREFGTIARNKSGLERGGNVIDTTQSQAIADRAKEAADIFNIQKVQVGPISNILNEFARKVADEKPRGKALEALQGDVYEQIRNELSQTFAKRDTGGYTGGEGLADQQSLFSPEEIETKPTAAGETPATTAEPTAKELADQERASGQTDMFSQAEEPAAATEPLDPAKGQYYNAQIYGPGLPSTIPNPTTLRVLASRFGKVSDAQRTTYFNDMLNMDEHIRKVTGNTFKLDPDTFAPVRISDGASLAELTGKAKPDAIGAPAPQWPKDFPTDLEQGLTAVKDVLGDNATRKFSEMSQPERDLIMGQLAEKYGFPDPTNVNIAQEKFDLERGAADASIENIKTDMRERYDAAKKAKAEATTKAEVSQAEAAKMTQDLLATRNRLLVGTDQAALKKVNDVFFDYSDKNLLDQALGSLIPFNYWGRKNFVYAAKYFAAHPLHFAMLLKFYDNLEKENADNKIPGYARGNILLWKNPDGSKVMWNINSINPFNPLGSSEGLMQTVDAASADSTKSANTNPLAVLFGSEGNNGARNIGLIPTFFRPNPIIDIATKTGKINEIYKALGWATDNIGAPGPVDKQTLGLLPGTSFYKQFGAATGLTAEARKSGLIKSDIDLEAPLNELLFGKNAGKSESKLAQELATMVKSKQISEEQSLKALASIKNGSWTPEALTALDHVDGEGASRQLLSMVGLSSVVVNPPRQQLADQISKGYEAVKGQKGTTTESIDPKTSKTVKTYTPGAESKFFDAHPEASVLFSGNKSADQINQGLADNQSRDAIGALYDKQKNKQISAKDFQTQVEKLKETNPAYFEAHPIKQDLSYNTTKEQYDNIGGAKYDALTKQYNDLKAAGNTKAANKIYGSKEYQQVKTARAQFMADNPDFAKSYNDYIEKTYGTKPTTNNTQQSKTYTTKAGTQNYSGSYSSGNTKSGYTQRPGNTKSSYPTSNNKLYGGSNNKTTRTSYNGTTYNKPTTLKYATQHQSIDDLAASLGVTYGSNSTYKKAAASTSYKAPAGAPSKKAATTKPVFTTKQKQAYSRQIKKGLSPAAASAYAKKVTG